MYRKCKICGEEIIECKGTYGGFDLFKICAGNEREDIYNHGPIFCEKHLTIFTNFMNSINSEIKCIICGNKPDLEKSTYLKTPKNNVYICEKHSEFIRETTIQITELKRINDRN